MNTTFQPKCGDLFARAFNDKIRVLVICPEQEIADNGWLVYGVLVYRDGSYSAPRLVSVYATDNHICKDFPLPEAAALALTRRNAIIEKSARGDSLDHSDYQNAKLCGLNLNVPTFPGTGW